MPLVAGPGTAAAQYVGVCLPELPTPPPDGRSPPSMINLNRGLVTNFRFAGLLAKRDSTRVLVQVKGTTTDLSAPVVSR
jgi:hypothetical protein